MDLNFLRDTPPWDWPEDADEEFLRILRDEGASTSDRMIAAELAGDFTVVNDEIANALLSITGSGTESEELRARAVISLGPALDHANTEGFDDPDEVPITERTFRAIQESLQALYMDTEIPKLVRRRILEASVRAPQDWHRGAIRAAYSSDDEDWKLTAVFGMQNVRGFEDQILEALGSRNPDIRYEAVEAAGVWGVEAAWPAIVGLVTSKNTDKAMRLAAIGAAATIRPLEAPDILSPLFNSDDEDIVDAAHDALSMATGLSEVDDFDEDDEDTDLLN